jgi:hypothetical protein
MNRRIRRLLATLALAVVLAVAGLVLVGATGGSASHGRAATIVQTPPANRDGSDDGLAIAAAYEAAARLSQPAADSPRPSCQAVLPPSDC